MKKQEYVGFEVRRLSNLIMRKFEKLASEMGVNNMTVTHGWVIKYLITNKEQDIYQKDFEHTFSIRRSTATNILKLMEKNGLIIRVPVAHDLRLKKIIITDKAQEIHDKMLNETKLIEKALIKDISEEELETFKNILTKMKDNVEELSADDIC